MTANIFLPWSILKLFIDGDSILFRSVLRNTKTADFDNDETTAVKWIDTEGAYANVLSRIRDGILKPLAETHGVVLGMRDIRFCLTGSDNFRKELSKDYKAQRKPSPMGLRELRAKVLASKDMMVLMNPTMEADDILSIQCAHSHNDLMISEDKDLMQVPGWHWNPSHPEQTPVFVTVHAGLRSLLYQLCKGDSSDNVHGIKGIGRNKAKAICDPNQYLDKILDDICFLHQRINGTLDLLRSDIRMLWLLRSIEQIDNPMTLETLYVMCREHQIERTTI